MWGLLTWLVKEHIVLIYSYTNRDKKPELKNSIQSGHVNGTCAKPAGSPEVLALV